MTEEKENVDNLLEGFFEAGRGDAPVASADLMERIYADALAEIPAPPAPARAGLLARISEAIGGWPAMAGLATATVAGIWIGYAQPVGLGVFSAAEETAAAFELGDLLPGYGGLALEEG
ncbi:MAG: dihydroorotate dehydrogenase [Alphaproteobacteria bacterium]|nr:dihydroorotate dehydrogenase [Alphaproteobacteria bacterium]NNF24626.1 dihydroorotate dehydrogenase [Paracoccaceae bacterium]